MPLKAEKAQTALAIQVAVDKVAPVAPVGQVGQADQVDQVDQVAATNKLI
jgi:hypothetical protein